MTLDPDLAAKLIADLPFRYEGEADRIARVLHRHGIQNLGQIADLDWSDLLRLPGFGRCSASVTFHALDKLGLQLTDRHAIMHFLSNADLSWSHGFIAQLRAGFDGAFAKAEALLSTRKPDARYTCRWQEAPWTMNAWLIPLRDHGWAKIRGDTYGLLAYIIDEYEAEADARADLHADRDPGLSSEILARLYDVEPVQIDFVVADLLPLLDQDLDCSIWRTDSGALDCLIGPQSENMRRPRATLVGALDLLDVPDEGGLRHMLEFATHNICRPNTLAEENTAS